MDVIALMFSIAALALSLSTRRRKPTAPDLFARLTELERAERRRAQREAERT